MKKISFLLCLLLCVGSLTSHAQTPEASASLQAMLTAERSRIGIEKARLEAGFQSEDRACYKKFLVNRCLDEVNDRRREVMADLRRQETFLNEQERKAKASDQIFRTEQKASPEKQQEAADKRAAALKDFEARMEREKQKDADRAKAQGNEKANSDAAAGRLRDSQTKASARTEKQIAEAEEARKFAERQQQAKERKERHDREQREREAANRGKPPSKPLPLPE